MSFIEQIFILFFQLIESGIRFVFEFFEMLFSGMPGNNKEYKAEFASASTLLSSWNHGFNISGRRSLTIKDSYKGAMIISPTGGGKLLWFLSHPY